VSSSDSEAAIACFAAKTKMSELKPTRLRHREVFKIPTLLQHMKLWNHRKLKTNYGTHGNSFFRGPTTQDKQVLQKSLAENQVK
jgi:hypothetical protein